MPSLWAPDLYYDNTMSDYWTSQTWHPDGNRLPFSPTVLHGSQMEVRFARTVPTGLREDLAMFTIHYAVEAGPGLPMTSLDASDAARVETSFATKWFGNVGVEIADDWSIKEYAWRHFGADFPLDDNGFSKPGPYWRIQPAALTGTGASARLPDQLALTTTFKTGSRTHWGRIYAGGFTTAALLDSKMGHPKTTLVDLLAQSMQVHFNDIHDDARITFPLVWSAKYRGAMIIDELTVDDVFDVIRRRRAKQPSYRKTYTS